MGGCMRPHLLSSVKMAKNYHSKASGMERKGRWRRRRRESGRRWEEEGGHALRVSIEHILV